MKKTHTTPLKREGETLAESLSLLRATLESTADGILVIDRAGKITDYNEQFARMWNIPEDVLATKDDERALNFVLGQLKEPEAFLQKVKDLYSHPETESFDVLEFKDGRTFERYSRPQRLEGRVIGRVWSFRDVTVRKRLEQEMRAILSRQEALLTAIPDIIMEVDANKIYTWANRAGMDFFGEDAIGKEAAFYFEGEQKTYAAVKPLFDGAENVIYVESWQRRRDGQKRLLAWWCRVLKDERGKVTGALSSARDITAQRQVEEALRTSMRQFRGLYENATIGLYQTTPGGEILLANPALVQMLGFGSFGELARRNLELEGYHPEYSRREFKERLERNGEVIGLGSEWTRKDGSKISVRESARLVRDEAGNPLCYEGTVEDITARKTAEAAISRQNKTIEAVNTLLRETLRSETDVEIARICLAEAEKLTGSMFGWIGEVNPHSHMDTLIMSDRGGASSWIPESQVSQMLKNRKIRGLWGRVLIEGKSLITNDPLSHPDLVGFPEGHPEVKAFLGVPLKLEGQTIGLIALGNKPSDYEPHDLEAVETLAATLVETLKRKRAKDALRESEANLKEAQALGRIGSWTFDLGSQAIQWSDEVYHLYERDPALGPPGPDEEAGYYVPEQAKKLRDLARQATEDGRSFVYDLEARLPNGKIVLLAATMRPIKDASGRVVKLFGTVQDITERKRAEEAIGKQLEELRRWQEATLGRETRVLELKREVNELLARAGQPPRYASAMENKEP